MMFFKKQKEIDLLKKRTEELEKECLEKKLDIANATAENKALKEQLDKLNKYKNKTAAELDDYIEEKEQKKRELNSELNTNEKRLSFLKKEISIYSEDLDFAEIGLYTPLYPFATTTYFKEKLELCRNNQKAMINSGTAVTKPTDFTLNSNSNMGKKLLSNMEKQMLRCFNFETQDIISKAKSKNYETLKKRILRSFQQINKLNGLLDMSITEKYRDLKIEELTLAYEYALKIEEEKEQLRAERQREKEEKALQREINAKRKIIDKDIKHYENIIKELQAKLDKAETEEKSTIEKELEEMRTKQKEKEEEKNELDYREANATAGYVYVISNIGSFGNDVIKIGVTRRLDPAERIAELSSASVPFKFDVHALIFSDDAYKLEKDLHDYFSEYRVNKVNLRKEFFRIPIEKIEKKLEEYSNLALTFTKEAEAIEYKQTLAIEEQEHNANNTKG